MIKTHIFSEPIEFTIDISYMTYQIARSIGLSQFFWIICIEISNTSLSTNNVLLFAVLTE